MIGAVAGDIVGAPFEHHRIKTTVFPLFGRLSRWTDDSVMTTAVASAILNGGGYAEAMRSFGRRFPNAGYGQAFSVWLSDAQAPAYGSWGNGAAMRVSPVGWAFDTEERVLAQARATAVVSHNHPEGVKGAQAVALAVYLARTGATREELRDVLSQRFGYHLGRTVDEIRPGYRFDISCQGTVPEAVIAFLESTDYEDAVRLSVSLGGDSDTLACITGAIAEAFYGAVPAAISGATRVRLPDCMLAVVDAFEGRFGPRYQT